MCGGGGVKVCRVKGIAYQHLRSTVLRYIFVVEVSLYQPIAPPPGHTTGSPLSLSQRCLRGQNCLETHVLCSPVTSQLLHETKVDNCMEKNCLLISENHVQCSNIYDEITISQVNKYRPHRSECQGQ